MPLPERRLLRSARSRPVTSLRETITRLSSRFWKASSKGSASSTRGTAFCVRPNRRMALSAPSRGGAHRSEDVIEHGVGAHAFGLALEAQDDAVAQGRAHHRAHV